MINALKHLFFPEICNSCKLQLSDNEHFLCTSCRHHLPITNFHFDKDESVKKVFYGRSKIENGTALLRFEKKGRVQHLMHQLKYGKNETISSFFGDWLGEELKTIDAYNNIDVVIPVPLHPKKQKKRGYNQVTLFGQQIAKALSANYNDHVLTKIRSTSSSQASKKRLERWQFNNEQFSTTNIDQLNGKHILLVDDIITTGNTLEACILELNKAENIKISIAVMAIA